MMSMSDSPRECLLVLRRALLLVVRWVEGRLGYTTRPRDRGRTLTKGRTHDP
jgi:hypothetical protein